MNFFRVTMTGHGVQLQLENSTRIDAGFVKNQFVIATSEDEAQKLAGEQLHGELQQEADAGGIVINSVRIAVDEVVRSMKFWKLVQQEGFVFFPDRKVNAKAHD